jgi:hypothetical protein
MGYCNERGPKREGKPVEATEARKEKRGKAILQKSVTVCHGEFWDACAGSRGT